jgi:transposase
VSGHKSTVGVIGAVDPELGDHEEWIFDSINSDVVNSFLWALSARFPDEQILLIGDNASYHTNQGSKKYPLPPDIQLLFQPPYSPELNPQENVWKIISSETQINASNIGA